MKITIKKIRELRQKKKLNDFDFQELVKFFAQNIENLTLCEEFAFKDEIRKSASFLKIDLHDVQAVYNFYRKNIGEKNERN